MVFGNPIYGVWDIYGVELHTKVTVRGPTVPFPPRDERG